MRQIQYKMKAMKTEKEYVPYGEEWKDELMKLPKVFIINMLRNKCLECNELEYSINLPDSK